MNVKWLTNSVTVCAPLINPTHIFYPTSFVPYRIHPRTESAGLAAVLVGRTKLKTYSEYAKIRFETMNPERILKRVKAIFHINDIETGKVQIPQERTLIGVDFGEEIDTPEKFIAGVQRLKAISWYDDLKAKGLHMVPIPHTKKSQLLFIIGTTTAIGTAYVGYKHLKERAKKDKI